jgi:hypothetical protein
MFASQPFRQAAIRYWERRRIIYNLALVPPALFSYFIRAGASAGIGDSRHLSTISVIGLFLLSAFGANVCYTFAYALEFFFASDVPDSRWSRSGRTVVLIVGTLFAMFLALIGGRNIATMEYSLVTW